VSLHHQLPIYKVTYDLLGLVVDVVKNMPRDFKQSVGGAIRDECVKITVLVFRANVSEDKVPHLTELLERLQVAELLLRLSRDKRFVSIRQYAAAVKLTDNIGKQASGWRKASSPAASRSRP
jgi:hypothetical protein